MKYPVMFNFVPLGFACPFLEVIEKNVNVVVQIGIKQDPECGSAT